jgi:hypothetical protein
VEAVKTFGRRLEEDVSMDRKSGEEKHDERSVKKSKVYMKSYE